MVFQNLLDNALPIYLGLVFRYGTGGLRNCEPASRDRPARVPVSMQRQQGLVRTSPPQPRERGRLRRYAWPALCR